MYHENSSKESMHAYMTTLGAQANVQRFDSSLLNEITEVGTQHGQTVKKLTTTLVFAVGMSVHLIEFSLCFLLSILVEIHQYHLYRAYKALYAARTPIHPFPSLAAHVVMTAIITKDEKI
jgi:hypothetical protein